MTPLAHHFRSLLIVWLLALSGACAAPRGGGALAAPLRVLVYNIHAGKDAAGARNLEAVAEVVRGSGAELVLLQEVDRGTERSGREDQLATLRRLTGMHGAFGRSLHYQGGEYGIAVLSRWPLVTDSTFPLPVDPPQQRAGGSYEPRAMLQATVDSPLGRIHLLNTHLDASREDAYRLQEVPQVRRRAQALAATGPLVLVGGDFNATPESAAIALMTRDGWRDAWTGCGADPGLTYPADAPVKRIDYLFVTGDLRCLEAAVLDTRASDHRPVLFVLDPAAR